DTFNFLVVDKFGRALDHVSLVDLVRDLGNDNAFTSIFQGFDLCLTSHDNTSTTSFESIFHAVVTIYDPSSRKVRSFNVLHQLGNLYITIVDVRDGAIYDF